MNWRSFFKSWVLATVISASAAGLLIFGLELGTIHPVCWVIWAYFVLSYLPQYYIAQRLAVSKNPFSFTAFSLMITFFKVFIAIVIFISFAGKDPQMNLNWVWPFFAIYFVFTIFEVRTMMILSHPPTDKS